MSTPPFPHLVLHPPKRLGHLGVIADLLQSSGIIELIDTMCGSDPRMKVSHGECVQFLVLGIFAGEHGLWRLAERLDPYDVATLTGDAGVDLREFHDVRLGRMLDVVWDAGPERLQSALSLRVVEWARLDVGTRHFDTTSLSFYGAYEEDLDDSWAPELAQVVDAQAVPVRSPRVEQFLDGDGREAPVVTYGGKPPLDAAGKARTRRIHHTVPVRAVACFSSELYRQKAETLGAIARREGARSTRFITRLARRSWACAADARIELDALIAKQPFITLTLAGSIERRETPRRRATRGRPTRNEIPLPPEISYHLVLSTSAANPSDNAIRLRREATLVLIRNRLDSWDMSDEQMVATYGKQWRIEHAFSWLKSAAAINPMFLESPRRIQALCFLYCLALMLHALVQRNIRRYLKANSLKLPYQRNKPSDQITARFTYELFRNVSSQTVDLNGVREKRIHGLDQWTTLALKAMSASPKAYKPVIERPRK